MNISSSSADYSCNIEHKIYLFTETKRSILSIYANLIRSGSMSAARTNRLPRRRQINYCLVCSSNSGNFRISSTFSLLDSQLCSMYFLKVLFDTEILTTEQLSELISSGANLSEMVQFCNKCHYQVLECWRMWEKTRQIQAQYKDFKTQLKLKALSTCWNQAGGRISDHNTEIIARIRAIQESGLKDEEDKLDEEIAHLSNSSPSPLNLERNATQQGSTIYGAEKKLEADELKLDPIYDDEYFEDPENGADPPYSDQEDRKLFSSDGSALDESALTETRSGTKDSPSVPKIKRKVGRVEGKPRKKYVRKKVLSPIAQCPLCPSTLTKISQLVPHLRKGHGKEELLPKYWCEEGACAQEKKGFLKEEWLWVHQQNIHGHTSTADSVPFSPTSTSLRAMNALMERSCPVCHKFFDNHSNMQEHRNHVHSISKSFICHICAQVFKRKSNLDKHLTDHEHGVDKTSNKFLCHACPKSFRRGIQLELHARLHSADEKKLKLCTICGMGFRQEFSLKRHNIFRHGAGDGRTYDCEVCGVKFKIEAHLKQHLNSKSHGGPGTAWKPKAKKDKPEESLIQESGS